MADDTKFWARSPIYIVICVLLGFVIAGLLAQNTQLKADLNEVKSEQREQQAKTEDVQRQADRIIAYLRCISLTPVGERTEELVNKCLSEDLPAQPKAEGSTGGTSFLVPAPRGGSSQQPGNSNQATPANPSNQNNVGGNSNTGGNNGIPDQDNENTSGLLTPVINPLCVNLTPRICGTLGL